MQGVYVFLVFGLLVACFALANYINASRLERKRLELVAQLLPPQQTLEEFAQQSDFAYAKVLEGYKVWEKSKSIDDYAHLASTLEEALQYILLASKRNEV